jgi:hypothetical protein
MEKEEIVAYKHIFHPTMRKPCYVGWMRVALIHDGSLSSPLASPQKDGNHVLVA